MIFESVSIFRIHKEEVIFLIVNDHHLTIYYHLQDLLAFFEAGQEQWLAC
jgi:hypothetical protein